MSLKVVIGWFKLKLWMSLVDLNNNLSVIWFIELSDNNLASELVENGSFLNQLQSENCNFYG